jgi:iron complex outermembrane recepter protein
MESGPWARAIGDENVRNDILPCRRLLALTMSAVLSGTAWSAQDDKDPDSPEAGSRAVQMQAVEVVGRRAQTSFSESSFAATKTETAVLDLPQSVSAVTKETIREQSLQRLNEVTPFVAGANEFSVYDDITIRGFRSSDDRRVNGMRTYNSFWSQPSIAHLERVEVIKGPAAATFGDASPGGVINLVTKKPLSEARREIGATAGSFDHAYLAADFTGPLSASGALLYRLNLAGEDSGSFRNQVFHRKQTVAPSVSWFPREGTRMNLDLVHTGAESVLDRGQPNVRGADTLGLVPIQVSLTQPGDRLDTRNASAHLTIEQELGGRAHLVASHMAYRYEEKLAEHRIQRYLDDRRILLGYNDRDSDARVDTTTVFATMGLDIAGTRHKLLAGVDHARRSDSQRNFSAGGVGVFDVLAPEYRARDVASYPLAESGWSPFSGYLRATGVYIQDQVEAGDWQLLASVRRDTFRTGSVEGGVPVPEQSGSAVSPRLGAVYSLDRDRRFYGSWITGFEPADPYLNSSTYGGPFDPVDSELLEIGYKQLAFDGRLLLTAALYELTKRNAIVYANDQSNPDLYLQRGEEQARGFELELAGRVTERLRVIGNYAYNDARITRDSDPSLVGKPKENAPRHAATVWSRYDFTPRFGVGAGVVHVGDRATFESGLSLPSYTVFNAALYYRFGDFDASLMVRNLSDRTHWTGGYNFGRVFPGAPRNLLLSLGYRF